MGWIPRCSVSSRFLLSCRQLCSISVPTCNILPVARPIGRVGRQVVLARHLLWQDRRGGSRCVFCRFLLPERGDDGGGPAVSARQLLYIGRVGPGRNTSRHICGFAGKSRTDRLQRGLLLRLFVAERAHRCVPARHCVSSGQLGTAAVRGRCILSTRWTRRAQRQLCARLLLPRVLDHCGICRIRVPDWIRVSGGQRHSAAMHWWLLLQSHAAGRRRVALSARHILRIWQHRPHSLCGRLVLLDCWPERRIGRMHWRISLPFGLIDSRRCRSGVRSRSVFARRLVCVLDVSARSV
jgi:hypothetical protein